MMNIPVQFQYSSQAHPASPVGYRRPGMGARELNAAAKAAREDREAALAKHEREADRLFAETRQLTVGKWGNDHHGGVPKPRWIAFHARHGHLFERREPPRSLAKRLEPPLPVYLLDVEPIDFIGKEPCQLKETWSNGERRWITYEWTNFGEKALAEGRYP